MAYATRSIHAKPNNPANAALKVVVPGYSHSIVPGGFDVTS